MWVYSKYKLFFQLSVRSEKCWNLSVCMCVHNKIHFYRSPTWPKIFKCSFRLMEKYWGIKELTDMSWNSLVSAGIASILDNSAPHYIEYQHLMSMERVMCLLSEGEVDGRAVFLTLMQVTRVHVFFINHDNWLSLTLTILSLSCTDTEENFLIFKNVGIGCKPQVFQNHQILLFSCLAMWLLVNVELSTLQSCYIKG